MARRSGILLVGCVAAAWLFAPRASAADGRITFSGAIVAPTCAITGQDATAAEGSSRFRTCTVPGTTQGVATRYTVSVTGLTRVAMDDRLRRYFLDFIAVDDVPAQARLVVQTYL